MGSGASSSPSSASRRSTSCWSPWAWREGTVMELRAQFRPALILLVLFTILTGLAYPLGVTAIAQLLFPARANGSLIMDQGRAVGSTLIAQPFDDPRYFWG